MPRPPTTLFEDAIDVPLWLEADRLTPYAERSRRDRDIARRLAPGDAVRRVRAWWRAAAPEAADSAGAGARLERARPLLTLLMAALGAVAGTTVALAAFHYDGSQPVNVVYLVALLVGAQLVFLFLTMLLIPGRVVVLRRFQDLLAAISPGAWAMSMFRRLAQRSPDLARWFEWHTSRASARRFAKWQLVYWSQAAAVAFNVAALATAIVLVTFTDLAFGWSTTLDADPAAVARIVRAIGWPWHALAPGAVPSAELVAQSQFFRLDGGSGPGIDAPRALTAWWPFAVAAIVTYGLLPRLALLLLAAARLRSSTGALLLDDPRVTALLDRMASPDIATAAAEHAESDAGGAGPAAKVDREITGAAHAVIWEGSVDPNAARAYARERLGLDLTAVAEAGGSRALSADQAVLDELAAGAGRTLVVLTPSWEPPLLELRDFLQALRRRVGDATSIVVLPVPDEPRAVTDVERDTWVQAMGKLRDPHLYVETGAA